MKLSLESFFKKRKKNENCKFAIISDNCWGAEVYKFFKLKYSTPFIGLYIYTPDYLKLLKNLDFYLNCPLVFKNKSVWNKKFNNDYPLGCLHDIEIHFLHYQNIDEAKKKWEIRLSRMLEVDFDNYFFKICDRDLGSKELLKEYHNLPFKNKISFSVFNLKNPNHFIITNENYPFVPDGVKLFKESSKLFNLKYWLENKKILRY